MANSLDKVKAILWGSVVLDEYWGPLAGVKNDRGLLLFSLFSTELPLPPPPPPGEELSFSSNCAFPPPPPPFEEPFPPAPDEAFPSPPPPPPPMFDEGPALQVSEVKENIISCDTLSWDNFSVLSGFNSRKFGDLERPYMFA